jgi:hypothetical protein
MNGAASGVKSPVAYDLEGEEVNGGDGLANPWADGGGLQALIQLQCPKTDRAVTRRRFAL